jgi:hypothetical protein
VTGGVCFQDDKGRLHVRFLKPGSQEVRYFILDDAGKCVAKGTAKVEVADMSKAREP